MNFVELLEAYIAEQSLERTRGYVARGRPLSGLSIEALGVRWVETYRAVRVLEEEDREGELLDLRSEFDLRGVEPPLHLLAAEVGCSASGSDAKAKSMRRASSRPRRSSRISRRGCNARRTRAM